MAVVRRFCFSFIVKHRRIKTFATMQRRHFHRTMSMCASLSASLCSDHFSFVSFLLFVCFPSTALFSTLVSSNENAMDMFLLFVTLCSQLFCTFFARETQQNTITSISSITASLQLLQLHHTLCGKKFAQTELVAISCVRELAANATISLGRFSRNFSVLLLLSSFTFCIDVEMHRATAR